MDDERPLTDWEARVAKAKRDGTWGTDDEEPSPYPPRERRMRFWLGFGVTLLAGVVVQTLIHLLRGRPGSPFGLGNLADAAASSLLIAFFAGWYWTRPPRRKR